MVACHTFHIQDAYVVAVVDAEQENYKVEDVAVDDVVDSTWLIVHAVDQAQHPYEDEDEEEHVMAALHGVVAVVVVVADIVE